MNNGKMTLGILGCGGIAHEVADFIAGDLNKSLRVSAVCDTNRAASEDLRLRLKDERIAIVDGISALVDSCDLVLETAVGEIVRPLLLECIAKKKDVILLSIGGIFSCEDLLPAIEQSGIAVYHPSGAIAGVDAVYAASFSKITHLELVTSKPPAGLATSEEITAPKIIFSGTAREAYKLFPRNINVAATLFIASRFEGLHVVIKVDPTIARNVHRVTLRSDIVNMTTEVENLPLASNPKTSALAAASTKALLYKMFCPIKIGV